MQSINQDLMVKKPCRSRDSNPRLLTLINLSQPLLHVVHSSQSSFLYYILFLNGVTTEGKKELESNPQLLAHGAANTAHTIRLKQFASFYVCRIQ